LAKKKQPREVNDLWPQLKELRKLTGMTGGIHEAQALQLKFWGIGAFPHVNHKELKVLVDTDRQDVTYAWDKAANPPRDLAKRLAAVVTWVWQLLGPTWRVTVKEKDKILYSGKRLASQKKAADERRAERVRRSLGAGVAAGDVDKPVADDWVKFVADD